MKKLPFLTVQQSELALPAPLNPLPQSPQQPRFGTSFLGFLKHTTNPSMFHQFVSWKKATGGGGIQATPSHQCGLMDVETGPCLRDETCDGRHTVITEP